TGSMESGTRDDMIAQARSLGTNVQSSVSKSTDYLVCGAKVGDSKLGKARSNGHTQVITEAEWLDKIAGT
ncbi:MAG: BRCT domain-containing protein, partial [Gammaproteobacteria bacterium]|nr:BRCT domain-containing protein [Gammaproteobacteria bacterium]